MHFEVERHLRTTHEPLSIVVASESWDLYVFGVTRVQREWWVQMAIVGPRAGTVTVRVDASNGRGAAAHEIMTLVKEWLLRGDVTEHAFLEQDHREARAS